MLKIAGQVRELLKYIILRNPKWHRDEIILALDLYFQLKPGEIHSRNPKVQELSRILNALPIFDVRPDEAKFRNPNGVGLKLSNFLAIDPQYGKKGMQSFSKLDQEVFQEFASNKERLHKIATQIRKVAQDMPTSMKLYEVPEDLDERLIEVKEGKVLYKLHKYRERNSKIVKQKKEWAMDTFGKLECEACIFDFYKFYGKLGCGYMECHHRTPLADIDYEVKTSLDDLALVCSNCHQMLHRGIGKLTISALKELILKDPLNCKPRSSSPR